MSKKIALPKQYNYIKGETNPLYEKFNGWQKISYSQYNSFLDSLYKGQYFATYFDGIPDPGNIFSDFGSMCGEYLDTSNQKKHPYLDASDIKTLNSVIKDHPEGSQFEYEIVIDLEPFGLEKTCLQAFADRLSEEKEYTSVVDFKTGADTKTAYYTSDEYEQLDVYCYGLEELGFKNLSPMVILLGRNGNVLDKQALHFNGKTNMGLRLNGNIFPLVREYNRKHSLQVLQKIADTCVQISDYYSVYNKYLKQK